MAIYFSGTITKSGGVNSAIAKQLKSLTLKPVKKIIVQFDPFHPKSVVARNILFHLSTPRIAATNLNCIIKPNVVCDRSEPFLNAELLETGNVKFLSANLTELEILQLFNKHISSLAKPEEESAAEPVKVEKKRRKK